MKLTYLIFCAMLASLSVHAKDAQDIRPLLIGSAVPDVNLTDTDGNAVSLHDALGGKPSVVIFYRGGWCAFCNRHLSELANAQKDLQKLGYQIIAISPDSPENLALTDEKLDIGYRLYSDSALAVADAFGIVFEVDSDTLKRYAKYDINLEKSSGGKNQNRLPVSSAFIATATNEIAYHHVDPNYKFRVSSKVLLAAAESALKFHVKEKKKKKK